MPDTKPLAGRVALVTGASRGIGAAIAQRLASAGAHVVVSARSLARSKDGLAGTLQDTVSLIERAGGKALALPCDVENADSRAGLIADIIKHAGRLDILVNNAGRAIHTKIENFTPAAELSQVQQYLLGPYDFARLAVDRMRKQGGGQIVFLGSNTALTPEGPPWNAYTTHGGAALYAALKAAIHRLVINLAAELEADKIYVNAVAPVRAILTPGVDSLGVITADNQDIVEPIEHIAEAALALVSASVTGKIAFSYRYLDELRRSTWSLDGARIVQSRG